MTSHASKGPHSSSASSSHVSDLKHANAGVHYKSSITDHVQTVKGAFSDALATRKAPLPPDTTPKNKIGVVPATNTAEHHSNFLSRGIHDVSSRISDIAHEFTGHQRVDAVTDMMLLPTHLMEDQVYKPLASKAVHVVAEAGPTVLKATVGPLVLGGVVVIAAAIFIFASYKEVNHVVDRAIS